MSPLTAQINPHPRAHGLPFAYSNALKTGGLDLQVVAGWQVRLTHFLFLSLENMNPRPRLPSDTSLLTKLTTSTKEQQLANDGANSSQTLQFLYFISYPEGLVFRWVLCGADTLQEWRWGSCLRTGSKESQGQAVCVPPWPPTSGRTAHLLPLPLWGPSCHPGCPNPNLTRPHFCKTSFSPWLPGFLLRRPLSCGWSHPAGSPWMTDHSSLPLTPCRWGGAQCCCFERAGARGGALDAERRLWENLTSLDLTVNASFLLEEMNWSCHQQTKCNQALDWNHKLCLSHS